MQGSIETRSHRAVALFKNGLVVREVAEQINFSAISVSRWQAEVRMCSGPNRTPQVAIPDEMQVSEFHDVSALFLSCHSQTIVNLVLSKG